MFSIKKVVKYALSLPKTIYFNFKIFEFKTAVKLPIWIHYHVVLGNLYRGCVKIMDSPVTCAMIKLGCARGSTGVFNEIYPVYSGGGFIGVSMGSKIIFHGSAVLAAGFSLKADHGGTIEIGHNFNANSYFFVAANRNIRIGNDCLIGWNVSIRDVDGHKIFKLGDENKHIINDHREVIIGDHVWIAAEVDILKGTKIGNGSIVAYRTMLSGQVFEEQNVIIGGNPPSIIKREIDWEE